MLFVRSCHGSAGREAGRTARPHDHARPRMTDHARTTDHARPRTTTYDHARTTAHNHARPRTTDHGCHICLRKRYPPHPPGFRGLNCLARLALARERTPGLLKVKNIIALINDIFSSPTCIYIFISCISYGKFFMK